MLKYPETPPPAYQAGSRYAHAPDANGHPETPEIDRTPEIRARRRLDALCTILRSRKQYLLDTMIVASLVCIVGSIIPFTLAITHRIEKRAFFAFLLVFAPIWLVFSGSRVFRLIDIACLRTELLRAKNEPGLVEKIEDLDARVISATGGSGVRAHLRVVLSRVCSRVFS